MQHDADAASKYIDATLSDLYFFLASLPDSAHFSPLRRLYILFDGLVVALVVVVVALAFAFAQAIATAAEWPHSWPHS